MARKIPGPVLAVTVLVVPFLLGSSTSLGWPQEPAPGGSKDNADKDADKPSALRRAAEELVDTIDLEVLADGKWSKVKRLEKPLLLYTDDTRENDRGSIWAWCDKGRPLALFEMFQRVSDRTIWVVGICNTSGRKTTGKPDGRPLVDGK
jgi:hypothetical protein